MRNVHASLILWTCLAFSRDPGVFALVGRTNGRFVGPSLGARTPIEKKGGREERERAAHESPDGRDTRLVLFARIATRAFSVRDRRLRIRATLASRNRRRSRPQIDALTGTYTLLQDAFISSRERDQPSYRHLRYASNSERAGAREIAWLVGRKSLVRFEKRFTTHSDSVCSVCSRW